MVRTTTACLDEYEKVRDWRLHVIAGLRDADGARFTDVEAELLAATEEIDLHALALTLERGCRVQTALHIYL